MTPLSRAPARSPRAARHRLPAPRLVVLLLAIAPALGATARPAAAQHEQHSRDSAATRSAAPTMAMPDAAAAASSSMSGDDPFMARDHVALSPERPRNAADSARAAALVQTIREALRPFASVSFAEREGYRIFAPDVPGQRVYHFNNFAYGLASEGYFEPTKPTSLLYRKEKDGRFTLVGAMYTAAAELPLDSLNARVPLSVARWHRHVDFCFPSSGGRARWREKRHGRPVFGPRGVATRAECEAAGGRFIEQLFGWMVHVRPFGTDDPYVAFGMHGHHD